MLKKLKTKLMLLISCLLVGVSAIASGAFVRVNDLSSETDDIAPSLVCVAQNMSTGDEYYTIHEALEAATSGQTVVIYPGTNPILYKNATVKTGVTLALPLVKEEYGSDATGNSDKATSTTLTNTYTIVNKMYINPNITLTVNGTLSVFGILSGGGGGSDYASHTAEQTSAIYMDANSAINVNGGNILCRGYIYETTTNNNSRINFVDGDVMIPTVMRDFKGGSVMKGYHDDGGSKLASPFDQLMFPNIEPFMSFDYNSNLNGTINLSAGGQQNNATQTMIGNGSDAFVQLIDENSCYEIKYDPATETSNLEFFGDVTMNSLKITIKYMYVININVDSANYFYSLSHRLAITLSPFKNGDPSIYTIPNRCWMLPGSYLKVNKNATLNIQSNFSILDYEENSILTEGETKYFYNDTEYLKDQVVGKYCKDAYPKSKSNATFINNGVVNVTGSIAGRIENEEAGAVLTAGSNSVTNYCLKNYESGTLGIESREWETITNTLRGQVDSEEYETLSSGTYVSNENNYWVTEASSNTISITLEVGGDAVTTASVDIDSSIKLIANVTGPTRTPSWTPSTSNNYATITPNGLECTIKGTAKGSFDVTCTYGSASATVKITINDPGCILADTMVMLSDGSEKKVQDLTMGDELMSFDHYNGNFIGTPLLLNGHAEEDMRFVDVLTLYFSNEKSIRIAYNHGFYNLTRNGYVTIDNENVEEYLGEQFYFYNNEAATLTDYTIKTEYVKVYAPFAKDTFNCVTNGLISVPGVASNFLLNVYEYDENMTIDRIQLENDIEEYGLFTYEDLANYTSYEMFEILKLKYVKIGIGKGYYTLDDVIEYIGLYSKYFE